MKNKNYHIPMQDRVQPIWPPIVIGALQVPAMFLINLVVVKVLLNSASDSFNNGLSGLALALAFSDLIGLSMTVVLPVGVVLISFILLRQLQYRRPLVLAIVGTVLVMIGWRTLADAVGDINIYLFTPLLLAISAVLYQCAYLFVSSYSMAYIKIASVIVLVLGLSLIGGAAQKRRNKISSGEDNKNSAQTQAQGLDFDIYAPNTTYFSAGEIRARQDDPNSKRNMWIEGSYKVAEGEIKFREIKYDDYAASMFISPDSCDYEGLHNYSYGNKYSSPSSLTCEVVYESSGRQVMQADSGQEIVGHVPFVARIGNTVIVFSSYPYNHSSAGYRGTLDQASIAAIDFVKNARIITKQELGIKQ
jgi:hypothetical protein